MEDIKYYLEGKTFSDFKKAVKEARLTRKAYGYQGTIEGRKVDLRGCGTWLQVYLVDSFDYSCLPGAKVGEFNEYLEFPFRS